VVEAEVAVVDSIRVVAVESFRNRPPSCSSNPRLSCSNRPQPRFLVAQRCPFPQHLSVFAASDAW
jgi:hypothetical protein